MKKLLTFLLLFVLVLVGNAIKPHETGNVTVENPGVQQSIAPETTEAPEVEQQSAIRVSEDGEYSDKDHVALYIHMYGKLPNNFITKKEAEQQGWDSREGNLHQVLPGQSIGGDRFGNYEGLLPTKKGRQYTECDIDYKRGSRNAKRIIFSNDGLIYYTDDHYESFEQLY